MIKQFVLGEFCLEECGCCCRFSQRESIWSPAVLNEEIPELLKNNIPPSVISKNKKIRLVSFPERDNPNLSSHIGNIFICSFLNPQDSKCKIYPFRPLECQLYPFLINRRKQKIFLAVDLGCAFIKKKLHSQEFKEYLQYLEEFFNNPSQLDKLRNNPQIIQAYEEALDLGELKF